MIANKDTFLIDFVPSLQNCPRKAQCFTYHRVNRNRRLDKRRSQKMMVEQIFKSGPGPTHDGRLAGSNNRRQDP